jgi:hypothetical protein
VVALVAPLGSAHTTRGKIKRRLAWTGLYAGIAALASLVARRAASGLWRKTTGEEPPAKN